MKTKKPRGLRWWYKSWVKWHVFIIHLFPKYCDCIYTLEYKNGIMYCYNCKKVYED